MAEPYELTVRTIDSLDAVDSDAWDALVGSESPFLEWGFLSALEEAGCVGVETGWGPQHLIVESAEGELLAAAPMYLKGHSAGEFVFDHAWADAAYRAGIPYYPKLVVAVPFTPVRGARALVREVEGAPADELRRVLADTAWEVAREMGVSGVHWLFVTDPESEILDAANYETRFGIQYHWLNRGYDSYDEWLAGFKSKRRRTMRRERREIRESDVTLEVIEGDGLTTDVLDTMFELYLTTIDKKLWGRQYLNRRFFHLIAERFADRLLLIYAVRDDEVVAGSMFVKKDGHLHGRYWGAFERVRFLHFEVCYYKPVELCIERGWTHFGAGAQGQHKYKRGFDPIITRSAHRLVDRRLDGAVRDYLRRERAGMARERRHMQETSPCRRVQEGLESGALD